MEMLTVERVALAQGLFYAATGLWPLVHMRSFLWVTGPKTDLWLVKTVGVIVLVVGCVLLLAAGRAAVSPEVALLATGCAAALAGVDFVYVAKRAIGPVYLLDAAAEIGLIAWWAAAIAATAAR
jgi:hypothetical protein